MPVSFFHVPAKLQTEGKKLPMPHPLISMAWTGETLYPCPVCILPRKAKPCTNLQDACGCQHMQCTCCPEPQATHPLPPLMCLMPWLHFHRG